MPCLLLYFNLASFANQVSWYQDACKKEKILITSAAKNIKQIRFNEDEKTYSQRLPVDKEKL